MLFILGGSVGGCGGSLFWRLSCHWLSSNDLDGLLSHWGGLLVLGDRGREGARHGNGLHHWGGNRAFNDLGGWGWGDLGGGRGGGNWRSHSLLRGLLLGGDWLGGHGGLLLDLLDFDGLDLGVGLERLGVEGGITK